MMKKVFFLKTCGTCRKIMAEFDLADWALRELKSQNVTEAELEEMYALTKSYESLFSKRSKQILLKEIVVKDLKEADFKNLILEHYSFLKRPVFLTPTHIFAGSDKSSLDALHEFFTA